jgi:hypothetical protein
LHIGDVFNGGRSELEHGNKKGVVLSEVFWAGCFTPACWINYGTGWGQCLGGLCHLGNWHIA